MPIQGFGEVAERLRRSTVQVRLGSGRERGSGSGVIWNQSGLIVTNAHVARQDRAQVELWDGRTFEGNVTSRHSRRDLAAIQIDARGLPAIPLGDSGALRTGELVLAVGNPLGFIGALTTGVVHGHGPLRGLGRQNWVQAAVRLAPGNSGGPLADAQGRLIGINTMLVAGGLALAIPSNSAAEFVKAGPRPRLGVSVRPVETGPGPNIGLLVLEVEPHGSAASASLLLGDLLTGANGKPFRSADDLSDAVEAASGVLTLQFQRGERRTQREVTVQLFAAGVAA